MLQCSECEHFQRLEGGQVRFTCDPFVNIKEQECILKWQLLRMSEQSNKLDRLVAAYEATVAVYRRLAPLQEKMFRHMEREIDETDESDRWKLADSDEAEDEAEPEEEKDDSEPDAR